MATGKDKFDLNNDQKFKQDNLDKSDGPIAKTEILKGHDHEHDPIAKTEILDGQPEHGNQSHVSEPTADGVIFPGNENFDINNDQKIALDKSDVSKVELNQGLGKYVKDGEPGPDGPMGPPQDPQGMGLDRLGTQFDEDGMGDMHKPDDPNDGGELV